MIQRVQTIYLLLAAVLMGLSIAGPFGYFHSSDNNLYTLNGIGFWASSGLIKYTWGILIVNALCALLAFATIFFYKNRKLQLRMCLTNVFLILFSYVTVGTYAYSVQEKLSITFDSVGYSLILPVIAWIFVILAFSRIKKDEKLIKSLDRIR